MALGSVVTLQRQDTDSIAQLAQWVKWSSLSAATAQVTTAARLWSPAQELHMPWGGQKRKQNKNKIIQGLPMVLGMKSQLFMWLTSPYTWVGSYSPLHCYLVLLSPSIGLHQPHWHCFCFYSMLSSFPHQNFCLCCYTF